MNLEWDRHQRLRMRVHKFTADERGLAFTPCIWGVECGLSKISTDLSYCERKYERRSRITQAIRYVADNGPTGSSIEECGDER